MNAIERNGAAVANIRAALQAIESGQGVDAIAELQTAASILRGGIFDRKAASLPDATEQWAQVELYRWQYGELPPMGGGEHKPLSVPAGLNGLADAIRAGDRSNFPTPYNVEICLRYAARLIDEQRTK